MIYRCTIFVVGYLDTRVSSSVVLAYGATIRWLHFAHAQSICTRPLDQLKMWPGDEANGLYTETKKIILLVIDHFQVLYVW